VAYLESAPASAQPASPALALELAAHGRCLWPSVLPLRVGQSVDFSNLDGVYHSLYGISELHPFRLGRKARGPMGRVAFRELPATGIGVIPVFCDLHPDERATLLVMRNACFAALPETGGSVEFTGLPAGTYTLTTWHPLLRPATLKVRVEAGAPTPVNLSVKGLP